MDLQIALIMWHQPLTSMMKIQIKLLQKLKQAWNNLNVSRLHRDVCSLMPKKELNEIIEQIPAKSRNIDDQLKTLCYTISTTNTNALRCKKHVHQYWLDENDKEIATLLIYRKSIKDISSTNQLPIKLLSAKFMSYSPNGERCRTQRGGRGDSGLCWSWRNLESLWRNQNHLWPSTW